MKWKEYMATPTRHHRSSYHLKCPQKSQTPVVAVRCKIQHEEKEKKRRKDHLVRQIARTPRTEESSRNLRTSHGEEIR
jgi:hypothetical protein